ncbi:glycosyltransferase family 2 protein [Nocardioides mangrovi]|uniref:Glycosyltransferase family 2 protein n=1 Tax=Nocardioides mangrovi TaxID=2874580 RepID=A0ABS7U999_9ACTN|nr:glycosyltransferase family 2 protein [Nocardioides mangrovi]MBZ5737293.1 glycosyltransferase family 2 protein [Nocardioides mangrovi]
MARPLFRRGRSEGQEAETSRPTVCVMTMVRDEAEMLPRWVRHYAAQVGAENLVVLDDNSSDGSTEDLPCTVHRLPALPGPGYERARMTLLSGLAAGFLAVYDYVVFVDADEFILPDPVHHADLPAYLAARPDQDVLAPLALNVVQVPSVEGPLRPDEPVLDQRRFAKFTPLMCKPSVKRVPAGWRWASHGIEAPFAIDRELFMLHLKFADRDGLEKVAAHRRALVEADGRAKGSSWARSSEDLLKVFDKAVADVDAERVPEFDPRTVELSGIVQQERNWFRSTGQGQVPALRHQPLVRVPSTLLGTV